MGSAPESTPLGVGDEGRKQDATKVEVELQPKEDLDVLTGHLEAERSPVGYRGQDFCMSTSTRHWMWAAWGRRRHDLEPGALSVAQAISREG